jgi:ribose/xylose/arabinose/galactoside ABC-type transport system permease subunit
MTAFAISRKVNAADLVRVLIPIAALAAMAVTMAILQPRVTSYFGMQLVLRSALPLMFAAMAQLCVIAAGDIDFSIGPYIGFTNCLTAAFLVDQPVLCVLLLALGVLAYAGMGAFIQVRKLPSIVVTLGASFVWIGLALLVMPTPGGQSPAWLSSLLRLRPPIVPLPIVAAVLLAIIGHWIFKRSSYGVVLRGIGSSENAVRAAGWSIVAARSALYGLAGVFGTVAGLTLTGMISSGDANVGTPFTLLSISAVIVGGAEFTGGIISPVGAIAGVFVMVLAGALLSFMDVPSDWQLSVQGTILILALAARVFMRGKNDR